MASEKIPLLRPRPKPNLEKLLENLRQIGNQEIGVQNGEKELLAHLKWFAERTRHIHPNLDPKFHGLLLILEFCLGNPQLVSILKILSKLKTNLT